MQNSSPELPDPLRRLELASFGPGSSGATRTYFGNEFCERLIPSPPQATAAVRRAGEEGRAITLVLPVLGPAAFERAAQVLDAVARAAPGTEVVANDWGVLRRAASDERLVVVMGRCLNRTIRDPRLPVHVGEQMPPAAREALRGGPFRSRAFRALRERYRVSRLEIDVPPLGIAEAAFPDDLPLSVYLPFGFVASGRICVFAAAHRPDGPERMSVGECRYECATASLLLTGGQAANGLELRLRGNTVFYRHDARLEAEALAAASRFPIDRVVWQPDVPMWRPRDLAQGEAGE
ncbi:MAG: hypothetical protein HYY06_16010 [Deltaproteobacteria bacterium]|nr:hypothetical protein [Deltaproteobacteria bacterium]